MAIDQSFDYLCELAARAAEAQALLATREDEAEELWNGVGFNLAEHRCVVPMNEVSEVLLEPPVTRLPGVKPWVKGVANIRGRLLPLVDLAAFLGMQGIATRQQRRVLVYERGDVYLGLLVAEVTGMQYFPVSSLLAPDGLVPDVLLNYSSGAYRVGASEWTVFRLSRLLDNVDFFDVAA